MGSDPPQLLSYQINAESDHAGKTVDTFGNGLFRTSGYKIVTAFAVVKFQLCLKSGIGFNHSLQVSLVPKSIYSKQSHKTNSPGRKQKRRSTSGIH